MDVIVIGSGIAGLAVSIRLRCLGFTVTVLEAHSRPGGKLSEHWQAGCRFDRGPSLLTLPHYIDDLFHVANKQTHDYLRYTKLTSACKYFYPDGTIINGYTNPQLFATEIEKTLAVSAQTVLDYLQHSAYLFELTAPTFLDCSLHDWHTYLQPKIWRTLLQAPNLGLFTKFATYNQTHLKHPKLVQLFNRFATYNGSNPYQAPATLAVIAHLEHGLGSYIAEGGMYAVVRSLYELALDLGIKFFFNEPAEQIITQNHQVIGVKSAQRFLPSRRVVSNVDVNFTYHYLLGTNFHQQAKKINPQSLSTSACIFYFNIRQQFPELDLHNIFFSADDRQEFNWLWDKQEIYLADPTIYLYISSKKNLTDAPPGYENWFVMINTPVDQGQDWPALRQQLRTQVINKISQLLGKDVGSLITNEDYLDPPRIANNTGSYAGALYGLNSNSMRSAFMRQANRDNHYHGLYFCGGSVHPGGGIPLCVQSAKITAHLINQDI